MHERYVLLAAGQALPPSDNVHLDKALSSTLRVFPSQFANVSIDSPTPERRHSLEHEDIIAGRPERPDELSASYVQAADVFDDVHRRRTERANECLRELIERSPADQSASLGFTRHVHEVQRTRLRVHDGPQVTQVHKAKDKRKPKFNLFNSVWKERAKTSDARDFYDSPQIKRTLFEHDWAIAASKYAFDKKLDREAKKMDPAAASQTTVADAKEALFAHFNTIYGMFNHYASVGTGDDLFAVSKKAFDQMLGDCALANDEVVGQRYADINVLFEGVNAKGSKGELYNHRKTLNREEWVGMIVQLVIIRHIASDDRMDVYSAFDHFISHVRPRLPLAAVHDTNSFRADFCYLESTDWSLRMHEPSLRVLYDVFAYGTGAIGDEIFSTKLLDLSEFKMFVDRLGLVDEFLTVRDVDKAFSLSRMIVVQENTTKGRSKLVQLRFEDFLEVLVRFAYLKALPTDDEIAARSFRHAGEFLTAMAEAPAELSAFSRARTRAYGEPLEQSIGKKVLHFINWMLYRVRGGVETGKAPLSKAEAEHFRKGHVRAPRMETDGSQGTDGTTSVVGADPDVIFVRSVEDAPQELAAESDYRS